MGTSNNSNNRPWLSARQRVFYALPVGAFSLVYGGSLVVLQGVYAKYYGLSLTTIAAVLLIANVFDAVTDPVVGYCSDRYYARTGTRKPFIFAGAVLCLIGAYYLFIPAGTVTGTYLLGCYLLYFLGVTLFNVPHNAWGSDVSYSSSSSTRLFALRTIVQTAGGLMFYTLPQLPWLETTAFTPQTLQWAVYIFAVLIVPTLFLCLYFVPDSCRPQSGLPVNPSQKIDGKGTQYFRMQDLAALGRSVLHNKAFLLFLGAFFISGLGSGSWGALLFIYVDTYLEMGERFSLVSLLGMGMGVVVLPLWTFITMKLGKSRTWILAAVVTAVSIFSQLFLVPKSTADLWLALTVVPAFLGFLSFGIFVPALLSDIVDYSTWKFDKDYSGSYFSLYFLVTKTNVAIGGALGLAIAGWSGFDPANSSHDAKAVWGLQVAAIWLPALLMLLSILFIYHIPLNARRHAVIRKALARREKRKANTQ